jgi:hypothetical protein
MVKKNKIEKAKKFDMLSAQVLLLIYVALNIYFIAVANAG